VSAPTVWKRGIKCLLVGTPTKGKDIRDQIPEIRDKKCFARCGRFTPVFVLQFFRKVVSSPGGTTDLKTTNSFGGNGDLFVGEDTDKGERYQRSDSRKKR
jgi:hypothetical protein